ncbi:MAG TPA: chemotaxis protein CheB [Candidatus Bathyarchaeia archaeon]|nr:chemotaxis protein CheB [Candidatus Bathyarchaeia archaeon]
MARKPASESRKSREAEANPEKIKRLNQSASNVRQTREVPGQRSSRSSRPFPIVGIGASAGGLEAFSQLLKHLPQEINASLVLVQHLDPTYKSMLTELLSKTTKIPVAEVKDGLRVLPGHVYVIPPNANMTISKGVLHLTRRLEAAPKQTPIDTFLKSLAEDRKMAAIGVILSGTSLDGIEGLRAIKQEGGVTFAQNEASAKYYDLPRSAVHAGVADMVLSPPDIAKELVRLSQHPYFPYFVDEQKTEQILPQSHLGKIFALLLERTGADFSNYKHTTIRRRILRRMMVLRIDKLEGYVGYLKNNPGEAEKLFQEILIHVTGFFREPETFQALKADVFPQLTRNRPQDEPIRVWLPGCSTGEEAYSLGISLTEFLDNFHVKPTIQIFATDINENVLAKAREGIYADVSSVSPGRLRRFFTPSNGNYQINKSIRNMVVFAKQDVIADPPFSKMDLVICRNVLIYLGPVLQKKLVPILHFALKPTGFLVLGNFESIGNFSRLFKPTNAKHRIFAKRLSPAPATVEFFPVRFEAPEIRDTTRTSAKLPQVNPTEQEVLREADRILLSKFSPASVIINSDMEIVQFRGRTGLFLEPAPGKASLNLLKMAKDGLMMELRSAVQKAKTEGTAVRRAGIRILSDNRHITLDMEVVPLRMGGCFMITFEQATSRAAPGAREKVAPLEGEIQGKREAVQLQQELASVKEYLQSIIQEKEASNEELKAANEEIQSSNEELQSTNEELETAKEELQSTNEELTTVNEELQNRNIELGTLNDDLNNLLTSVNIPIVILGSDLRIRRANVPAEKLLNLMPTDIGRSFSELKLNIEAPTLMSHIVEAMDTVSPREADIRDNQGRWWSKWIRPYRTSDNKIEGVVLSFTDIDRLKRVEEKLIANSENLERIVQEKTTQLGDATRLSAIGETAAMVGHDLRNPLQAIANTLHLAKEKAKNASDPTLVNLLDNVQEQAQYVNRIVTDLQDYARPVKATLIAVDATNFLTDILSSFEIPPTIKVVTDIEPGTIIQADPSLLRRALTNIVTNALQAMPKGGRLSIKTVRGDKTVQVNVVDNGEGINQEAAAKIFNPLFTTRAKGTGLGLPIAKRLIEAHEGSIRLTSEPGKGTSITIELPRGTV